MNINRRWKKILVVGCSHGRMADPKALKAALDFRKKFQPDTVVHLGDFVDMTAFRAGAKGNQDETEPIPPDVEGGLDFLEKLEPTLVFCGNHEHRVWKLAKHYNAIVAACAGAVKDEIERTCKKLRADLVPYFPQNELLGVRQIGNFKFAHGYIFNENSARDHAEIHGNIVHAHTHRPAIAHGRRDDTPIGICVGTLARIPNMEYAKGRRSTFAWGQAICYGEYTENECQLSLLDHGQSKTEWRLPV